MTTYIYSWGPRGNLPGAMSRKGERCHVLARGGMNSALVEFEDGYLAVVSRNALRTCKPHLQVEAARPDHCGVPGLLWQAPRRPGA